jgi:hypothetical protein
MIRQWKIPVIFFEPKFDNRLCNFRSAFSIAGSLTGEGFQRFSGIRFIPRNRFSSIASIPILHPILQFRIRVEHLSHWGQRSLNSDLSADSAWRYWLVFSGWQTDEPFLSRKRFRRENRSSQWSATAPPIVHAPKSTVMSEISESRRLRVGNPHPMLAGV